MVPEDIDAVPFPEERMETVPDREGDERTETEIVVSRECRYHSFHSFSSITPFV